VRRYRLAIEGMRCAGCVSKVEAALAGVAGVQQASVNLVDRTASVQADGTVTTEALIAAIQSAGFDASTLQGMENVAEQQAAEQTHV